jgi:hypothetical protein
MSARRSIGFLVAICCAAAANGASVRGSVFLMPVETQFTSWGKAEYLNDLNQRDFAILSGTHRVTGAANYQMAVTGDTLYNEALEGPAEPGACYGTSLSVVADPPGLNNNKTGSWNGAVRCAPPDEGSGGGGGTDDQFDDCPPGSPPGCGASPIIVDLGHGGYRLTSFEGGVQFDLRNNGRRSQLAWTDADSNLAFLALDRNGNESIDNGSELFGNYTPLLSGSLAVNGYAALAELDEDGDGAISAGDAIWSKLLLWTDRNHDGYSTDDELQPIATSVVVALSTGYRTVHKRDRWGNMFMYTSTFYVKGSHQPLPRPYYDVFFTEQSSSPHKEATATAHFTAGGVSP